MNKYDIVILGGGLGGLLCGIILSREGKTVCILEKNSRVGGSIQSFARNGVIFNTGFNFTESLNEGETLNQYFKFFGLDEGVEFKRMDVDGFERISFSGDPNEYPIAQGDMNFVNNLSKYFPTERNNLLKYVQEMKELCNFFPLYTLNTTLSRKTTESTLFENAFKKIQSITTNEKLQGILAGFNSIYGGDKDYTPYYVHALINSSFIRSAWRIVNGSTSLTRRMTKIIEENNGVIYRRSQVTKLRGNTNGIEFAELLDGRKIYGENFISNIHPAPTLNLVESKLNKRGQKTRIQSLPNTIGMFTLYINLKKDSFPYINYNIHHFKDIDVWISNSINKIWPHHFMLYTPAKSNDQKWATGIQVITYMQYKEVEEWTNTSTGNRGISYENFKKKKSELLIDFIEEKFPNIRKHIESYSSSTPLTYRDYTGTPNGSAYGILKNFMDPYSTIISPKSRVNNLYFTGQNLNMHGILGVSIGAIMTCSEFLGESYLINKLKN